MIRKALPSTAFVIAVLLALPSCRHPPRRQEPAPVESAATREVEQAPQTPRVRQAIERGVVVLQADGDAWLEGRAPFQDGSGCVSCHQVPYGVWGLQEAARTGIIGDEEAAEDLTRRALAFVDNTGTGRPMSWSPLMLALGNEGAGKVASFVDQLLGAQRGAGFWEAKGQFPAQRRELSETNAVATMLAMLALADAAADDEAVAASLEKAASWVAERGPGESTEWLLLRAMVEKGRGQEDEARGLFARLVGQQNADGGWSWNPGEESNAMSTGEALYALSFASGATAPPDRTDAVDHGLDYLVASQGDDGWWRVASDLTSKGREESKDYVYAYWGTAWATIGLARSLEPASVEKVKSSTTGRVKATR